MLLESKTITVEVMPKYLYHCGDCDERFNTFHLMSEILEQCEKCEGKGSLKKLPLFPINLNKVDKKQKVGDVVKHHIEEAKDEIEKDKKKLKEKEYKP